MNAWASERGRRAAGLRQVACLLLLLAGLSPARADAATAPGPDVVRLGTWTFDDPARVRAAAAESGVPGGVRRTRGAVGEAVEFRDGDRPVILPLDTSLATALAVRFRYQPAWTSQGRDAGQGPRRQATLLSAGPVSGDGSGPLVELSLLPEGRQLELALGEAGRGRRTTARSLAVVLDAGRWSEVVLCLTNGGARVVFDGATVLDLQAGTLPGGLMAAFRDGVVVGGRRDGTFSALGAVDDMEWRGTPMGRIEALKLGRWLTAVPTPDGLGLDLSWRLHGGARVELQRSLAGATAWTNLARLENAMSFRDTGLEPARLYDYRILTNGFEAHLTARAGVRLPAMESPGTVALVIDETLERGLGEELARLERDLRAEGWQVVRRAAPRHDDRTWASNLPAIASVRGWLQEQYRAQAGRLRAVYLIGHVAIPYAGMLAEDTHSGRGDNHLGAWPADQYYADMDGQWTDQEEYPAYLSDPVFRVTRNGRGDGKWDSAWVAPNAAGETRLELAFARIDFSGMPVVGRGRDAELAALRRYLDKARRYREGRMPVEPRVVAALHFDHPVELEFARAMCRTAGRVFGEDPGVLVEQDVFSLPESRTATWGFVSGPGRVDQLGRGAPWAAVTSSALASGAFAPRAPFVALFGSWFGDWAAGENNLVRSVLLSKDHGVAAFWVRQAEWRFDALARGGTLADAQLETANDWLRALDPNRGTTRTLTILGDPTLRLNPLERPQSVRGERRGGTVSLSWTSRLGVWVYRAEDGPRGEFRRLTPEPITQGTWSDPAAPETAAYLVRAVRFETTGSGSYTNIGPGAAWPSLR